MSKRVLGVLAGRDMPPETLRRWADGADLILAADAGADRLIEAGAKPARIVGDLDSLSSQALDLGVPVDEVEDQNHTDCDKLLALAVSMSLDALTLASVEGDALDHLLATLSSTLRADLAIRLALRTGVGWVMRAGSGRAPSELSIPSAAGRRVSLIPLLPSTGVELAGVRWPLWRAELAPDGLVSVSNRAAADRVRASIESGAALLIAEYPAEEVPLW